jgi:hypothetical protein
VRFPAQTRPWGRASGLDEAKRDDALGVTQRRRRCPSKTTAARDKTERNPRFSNSRVQHNQHLGVLDQARVRAQVKPSCDSLGRHAQVIGKLSFQCCAIATMASDSRGTVARLIGGE